LRPTGQILLLEAHCHGPVSGSYSSTIFASQKLLRRSSIASAALQLLRSQVIRRQSVVCFGQTPPDFPLPQPSDSHYALLSLLTQHTAQQDILLSRDSERVQQTFYAISATRALVLGMTLIKIAVKP
jgi:hypothetical protein